MSMMPSRQNKSRLKNNRKILLIVSFIIIAFTIMTYTIGSAYAWFAAGATSTMSGDAAQIDTLLEFEIDETVYGIPGATQAISTVNKMKLGDKTDGYIFMISYIAEGETVNNVENIGLSKDIITELGLIEDSPSDSATLVTRTYYGIQVVDEQDLGKLYLRFKEVSEFNINQDIKVSVKLKVSQITKEAFQDAYSIPDSKMPMFQTFFS